MRSVVQRCVIPTVRPSTALSHSATALALQSMDSREDCAIVRYGTSSRTPRTQDVTLRSTDLGVHGSTYHTEVSSTTALPLYAGVLL